MDKEQDVFDDNDTWTVEHCGCTYKVLHDSSRTGIHPPSWYVQRMTDLRTSKRYYSRPGGAMNALASGSIVWLD